MTTKKGLLDKLATVPGVNFFVTDTDDPDVKNGVNDGTNAPSNISQTTINPPPTFVSSPLNSNVDPATKLKIEAIASSADQVSYTKFTELLAGMREAFPGDDNLAYKGALAAATSSKYPVAEVLRGLDVILRNLGKFEADFKSAVPAQIATKLAERQGKVISMEQDISAKRSRLAQLQTEANKLQDEIGKLVNAQQVEKSAMAQDEQGVRDDETRFMAAMSAVKSSYQTERQKIEEYSKNKKGDPK